MSRDSGPGTQTTGGRARTKPRPPAWALSWSLLPRPALLLLTPALKLGWPVCGVRGRGGSWRCGESAGVPRVPFQTLPLRTPQIPIGPYAVWAGPLVSCKLLSPLVAGHSHQRAPRPWRLRKGPCAGEIGWWRVAACWLGAATLDTEGRKAGEGEREGGKAASLLHAHPLSVC